MFLSPGLLWDSKEDIFARAGRLLFLPFFPLIPCFFCWFFSHLSLGRRCSRELRLKLSNAERQVSLEGEGDQILHQTPLRRPHLSVFFSPLVMDVCGSNVTLLPAF